MSKRKLPRVTGQGMHNPRKNFISLLQILLLLLLSRKQSNLDGTKAETVTESFMHSYLASFVQYNFSYADPYDIK
jgi:hypothetical protein